MPLDSPISIVSVNFRSTDWAKLLVDSVRKYSVAEHEIILVDNSGDLPDIVGAKIIRPDSNISHGSGLDVAIKEATGKYILALDIDAHILNSGWEEALISEKEPSVELVGAAGDALKPFRPCVSFFERDYFISRGHSFENVPVTCKGGFMTIDVGVFFALRTLHDGYKAKRIEVGDSVYKNVWGDSYYINNKPYFYHNWYGTRFMAGDEVIDGLRREDFLRAKDNLFKQIVA